MGNIWDELTNDGPEFLEEFGRTVVFRNQTFKALVSRAPVEQMLTNGGFAYNSSYSVRIYAPEGSALTIEPPDQGEHMTVFGRRYTITNVTYRPPDPWLDVGVQISSNA